jgi:hypothetical protein
MTNLANLSTKQLRSIIDIKEQIERLQDQLESISAGRGVPTSPRKRRMSRAGRARIIAAVKARWARAKAMTGRKTTPRKADRRSSPAVRAKLAAAAKARWAKAKAQGKTSL